MQIFPLNLCVRHTHCQAQGKIRKCSEKIVLVKLLAKKEPFFVEKWEYNKKWNMIPLFLNSFKVIWDHSFRDEFLCGSPIEWYRENRQKWIFTKTIYIFHDPVQAPLSHRRMAFKIENKKTPTYLNLKSNHSILYQSFPINCIRVFADNSEVRINEIAYGNEKRWWMVQTSRIPN